MPFSFSLANSHIPCRSTFTYSGEVSPNHSCLQPGLHALLWPIGALGIECPLQSTADVGPCPLPAHWRKSMSSTSDSPGPSLVSEKWTKLSVCWINGLPIICPHPVQMHRFILKNSQELKRIPKEVFKEQYIYFRNTVINWNKVMKSMGMLYEPPHKR